MPFPSRVEERGEGETDSLYELCKYIILFPRVSGRISNLLPFKDDWRLMHHFITLKSDYVNAKLYVAKTDTGINNQIHFPPVTNGVLTEGLMFDFQYRLRPMMMRGLVSVFTFVSAMMKFILLI